MEEKIYPIAVIGGGAAGVMSVLRAGLNNDEVLFFPGNAKARKRSRALWVKRVENIPGYEKYKRGIDEPHREALKFLADSPFGKNITTLKNQSVVSVEKVDDHFEITDDKIKTYKAKYVILATGVMDRQPQVDGDIGFILPYANVQVVDYCIRCDGHHIYGKDTAVIGHDMGAAWVAVLLHERYAPPSMTVLTHGQEPSWGESEQELLDLYGIKVVKEAIVDADGDAKKGVLDGFKLANGEFFKVNFSFISMGMIVYNELAQNLGAEVDERGFVTTNQSGESSVAGLFIAGDLRAGIKKQIYTAWDSAVDAADKINNYLRSEKRTRLLEEKRAAKKEN